MKSIERVDQQPTAVDQPLLRLRNVYQDRRSGRDRRIAYTCMDPAMDRRIGERRKNIRRSKHRTVAADRMTPDNERRKKERRKKIGWLNI